MIDSIVHINLCLLLDTNDVIFKSKKLNTISLLYYVTIVMSV